MMRHSRNEAVMYSLTTPRDSSLISSKLNWSTDQKQHAHSNFTKKEKAKKQKKTTKKPTCKNTTLSLEMLDHLDPDIYAVII